MFFFNFSTFLSSYSSLAHFVLPEYFEQSCGKKDMLVGVLV